MTPAASGRHPALTEAQQRPLTIGLRRIETELARLEQILSWTYDGAMVSFVDDLDGSARQRVQTLIEEARDLIRRIRDSLELPPAAITKSRWIFGRLVPVWVLAEECRSSGLRGYGRIAPALPPLLDPPMGRLADVLIEMQAIVSEVSARTRAPR